MKKRKTYEVSVINKTHSKTYSDETKFYTSDTALELNFQLKEVEYDFDSAEIILLNVDDRSLATRPVSKSAEVFTYELEDDITAHFGEWKGQLKFNEGGDIYVSSPVSFRIENDLNNDRPPKLTDIRDWETLRQNAKYLIAELGDVVANEAARIEAEKVRVEGYQEVRDFIDNFEIGGNSVGTPQLVDGAVTPEKTTFFNSVRNVILNGGFYNGTESWNFTSNSNQAVTDGKLIVTRSSTNLSSVRAFQTSTFEEGNKYLIHIGEFRQSVIGVETPKIITRNVSGQVITVANLENTTDIQSMSTIYTAKENTNYFDVYVYTKGVGNYFELSNVTVWNLTETFGLGKEPNLDDAKIMLETIFDGQIENSDYISQEGILNYFNQKIIEESNDTQTKFVRDGEDISVAGIQRKIIQTDGKNLEDYAFSFDFKPNISNSNLTSDIDYVLFAYENATSYLRVNYMRSFNRFNITSVKDGVTTALSCRPMHFEEDDVIHIYLKIEQGNGIFVGFYKEDKTEIEHLLTTNTFPNNFKQVTFGFRMREASQIDGNGNAQTEYENVKLLENAPNVVSHLNEVIK